MDLPTIIFYSKCQYEIAFNDTPSQITFPLIISCFAFAFPFLFSVVNQINTKYESEVISDLFTKSKAYNLFWIAIVVGITFIILAAFTSILGNDNILLNRIVSFTSVPITAFLVFAILYFVCACIQFNKPSSLLIILNNKYKIEKKRIANNQCINILNELCRYSFVKNDYPLFISTMKLVGAIINNEKSQYYVCKTNIVCSAKPKYISANFFDRAYMDYANTSNNREMLECLISKRLGCYSHNVYPSMVDIFWQTSALLRLADLNEFQFIEQYFSDCKYTFEYINYLPQRLYVLDGDVSKRIDVEKESLKCWNAICDYHFLLAAYTFYKGLKSFPKFLVSDYYNSNIIPHNRQELLLVYSRCKIKTRIDGGFDSSSPIELYGKRVDVSFIDFFAAMMFSILNDDNNSPYNLYSNCETEKILSANSGNLSKSFDRLKMDSSVTELYPEIKTIKFKQLYQKSVSQLFNKPAKEIYNSEISSNSKQFFESCFNGVCSKLKGLFFENIFGINIERKCSLLLFTSCPIRLYKDELDLLQEDDTSYPLWQVWEIFKSRCIYLYMKSLIQMKVTTIDISSNKFDSFIDKKTKEQKSEYVLIDFGSHLDSSISTANEGSNTIKRIRIDLNNYNHLQDSTIYHTFNGSMVLIKKNDLPVLKSVADRDMSIMTFDDESNYDTGCLDVRVNIDTNLAIVYDNNAFVVIIRHKKQ